MKVALVIERVESWRGGAETSTIQFAQAAARRGCDVTLVTLSRGVGAPGVRTLTVEAGRGLRARRTLSFLRNAKAAIADEGFDVVHAVMPCPYADVYEPRGGAVPEILRRNVAMRSTLLARGVKHVTGRLDLKYQALRRLERATVRQSPGPMIVAISRYVAEQFREHYAVPDARLRIVFNGVDPDGASSAAVEADARDVRQQYDLGPEENLALCVAHNFRLKGVGRLIEAVGRIPSETRQRIRVVIVGRDNPVPFARLAERFGVMDRIVFAGSTQRASAFYHAADLLVHPTYYDPCSRVVLEALVSGVPVVTTRFNGAIDVLTDGQEGFVLDSPDDVTGLADRIVQLLDEPTRARCAAAAKRLGPQVSMDRHAEQMITLYADVMEARR